MAHTKLYLDKRRSSDVNGGRVLVMIFNKNTSAYISTDVCVASEDWKNEKVVNRLDRQALNTVIYKKKTNIDLTLLMLESKYSIDSLPAKEIKRLILLELGQTRTRRSLLVSDVFAEYMQRNQKPNTRKVYEQTLSRIYKFAGKDVRLPDIDYKWLVDFDTFLSQTHGVNGKGVFLRALRAVCNYAFNTELIDKYPFKNFSVKRAATKKRNIKIDSLRKLYTIPIEPWKEKYREYFFLMFFLLGINVVDLCYLTKQSIKDDRLEYTRAKTGKKYSIKLQPEAVELINKHRGRKYLLDILDTWSSPAEFLKNMNSRLKEIGDITWEMQPSEDPAEKPAIVKKIVPVVPEITTYYARHSWATIASELDVPEDVVAQALGHSSKHPITDIYIERNIEKVDEANRRVIDYLLDYRKFSHLSVSDKAL